MLTREQKNILQNYGIGIRRNLRSLDDWSLPYEKVMEGLYNIEILARNSRQKIAEMEGQLSLEI